jgi:dipeptidyl aminopeptidase/acylaminoacyl peptidase
MTERARRLCTLVVAGVGLLPALRRPIAAQTAAFSLEQVLSFPFPDNLVAAPAGSAIAWTFNERGARNIYVAEGPAFAARRLTPYQDDDGQELTNLSFAPDGRTIVYVRGGDHGANWPADGNLQPDPSGSPTQPREQVWAMSAAGGAPVLLGDGDAPAIAPDGRRVAFERDRRIFIASIDGSKPAEPAFFARGASESPRWSPDGRSLAFVSNRDDHSFIGIFTDTAHPLRYLAASTSRDSDPIWSPDGRTIAFIRQPGRGGMPHSPLVQQPQPWSIWTASAEPATATQPHEVWSSGNALVDSLPRTTDGRNLRWTTDDRLVFVSYQDGWPHLYSTLTRTDGSAALRQAPGRPSLLTPGAFMVEHVSLTPDRRFVVYSANTGADRLDADRRHLFKVPVDGSAAPIPLTAGAGIEWTPVVTADGQSIAFLGSDAQRPPLPGVLPITGGRPRSIAADRVPAGFPSSQFVTPEQVIFTSSDGLTVHGQLFKASGGSGRRPALVYVHGGPVRQMLLGWHYMDYYANDYAANQYLASRGFIVLSINYRLGVGYGHAFQYPEGGGARGAAEYLDVLAGAKFLRSRSDVDTTRLGIWGGSYGGYLTALALGRNSDIFSAGVDIHGVHNWDRQGRAAPNLGAALAGDGLTSADLERVARVTYESSPISAVSTWKSPVLLIHADDDRNVEFHQTVDLEQRLRARDVRVETMVIPDDIHDFLLWRTWNRVAAATVQYFERQLMGRATTSQP